MQATSTTGATGETHQTAEPATADVLGMLRQGSTTPTAIARALDSMTHEQRVAAIRAMGGREQRRLWTLVDGAAPLTLLDMVPASHPTNKEVRHFGKNSLPLFTHFEKRFVRPEGQDPSAPTELHGYNYQDSRIATSFSGPGYFVTREDSKRSEVLVDYYKVPSVRPEGWPAIRTNERGGASLVYGFMIDTLRRVSEHVTIGRANKHGKDMNAWFILCRDAR